MEEAGVKLIAQGNAAYIGDLSSATKATNAFVDATDKGSGRVSAAGQVMIGGLRKVGSVAVEAFGQALKATAAFIGDSIGLAGDFEAGMLNFQAVAGKDVDAKGLEEFRDLFLDIGKRLPVSTMEVQQAAAEMVKGGIDPAILAAGGLERNIQFAAAAMEGDLVKAAEISSKVLGGWTDANATAAEKADFLTKATDLMTKAANASATDVEGLARGIFQAQGIAKTAGVGFDDLTTTLALLAPRFASSAEAGTSVKNMIARLQPTTDPAIQAMESLGLYTEDTGSAFYDAQGNFVGFQKASDLLQGSLAGLTKEQQAGLLQTIFGNDAMGAAAALADGGGEAYAIMAQKLADANGVTAAAALKQQGFNTAMDNAKGSVETLQIRIGSFLLPILGDLLDNYITPGINAVTTFAESFFKMVPAIQASDDPLQTFLNALKIAAPGLYDLIVVIEDIKDTITPAVNEIMRLADAFGKGGLGGLIDTLLADVGAALPDIEAKLEEWGEAFVDWIEPMIPPMLDKIADLADAAWDWVQDQAPEWGKQLLAWGDELVAWIAPMIPPALAELGKMGVEFLDWIGAQAAPLLDKFNAWAASLIEWIPGATVQFLAEWPGMLNEFLDWVGESAGPLLLQLGDWALAFIEWIVPMIPGFLLALGGIALAIGVWIVETAVVLNKKVLDWAIAISGWVGTEAIPRLLKMLGELWIDFNAWGLKVESDIGKMMSDVGASLVGGIKKGVSDAWSSLVGWLSNKVSGLVDAALDAIGAGSPATEWMPVGQFAIQGIMVGFQNMMPALTSLVADLGDDLVSQATDIASEVQNSIADAFGATASIDRQKAANLKKVAEVPEGFYRTAAERQLELAETQALAMADPAQGAKYFKMRSNQILEFQELQQQINEETNADTKKRLQQHLALIHAAQQAEIKQFDTQAAADSSGTQSLVDQLRALLANASMPGILESGTVNTLSSLLNQLISPPASGAQIGAAGTTNTYSQQRTYNMPIYTNQSPQVLQQSWAIMQASMP